ncbi:RHS repeat-associated protein [Labedaea rhizosphaerae]|uniref:RHS repeat-associated protein n=1 Tax=Labedaea rhizosphaerae TaxID=598644 RepID=A0A4R6SG68_LABRH|nr:RHS repeat-associated protein [Labedaea rhizosphaerae]
MPFTECPAIGLDTSCGVLIQVADGQTNIYNDASQGPYDGADDTLTGVVNNSSRPVSSLQLSSNTDLFGFDGDGLCTVSPQPDGCPLGVTGYEGPNTSFSNVSADATGGVVNFTTPLQPGETAYFSLEEALTATAVFSGGPSVTEQGGAPNPSEHASVCYAKAPINCATGVFVHQFNDITVPGRGTALTFARSYSSADAAIDGPLGFGWSDGYAMSLATDATGNVVVRQEDGSTVSFTANGSGGFVAPPRVLATLTADGSGGYDFTRRSTQVRYSFSSTGQLMEETDLNNNVTHLTYSNGHLDTVTDPAGRTLHFAYTGSRIASITDPMGRTESFSYDTAGNLVSAADRASRIWHFTYDASHQLLTMTDGRAGTVTNTYDASGRVIAQADAAGLKTTWAYTGDPTSPSGGSTTMTDEHGNQTVSTYANLELTSVVHAAGTAAAATTSFTYDIATLGRTTVTDPAGHVTINQYDRAGNLTATTTPAGETSSYGYNSLAEVTSKTTPAGETTSLAYDSAGNLTTVTDPLGHSTTYSHGDSGHPDDVTSITDPDGRTKTMAYDAAGDVVSVSVSPTAGHTDTTLAVYNADSERTCQTAPAATAAGTRCPDTGGSHTANTTMWNYNPDGDLTDLTDPLGHVGTNDYDANGNLVRAVDPLGNITTTSYDADNRTTATTKGVGTAAPSTTTFAYDLAPGSGACTASITGASYCGTATDPNGHLTVDYFSVRDQLLAEVRPGNQTTSHAYDLAGNESTRTDPAGRTTSYTYDADNRLTNLSYDGTTPAVSYSYDTDSRRIAMADGTGTTTYAYDPTSRPTSITDGHGNLLSYSYDGAGNNVTLTYPNGHTVLRGFDGAGRLNSTTDFTGHTSTFSYDPDGNLTTTTYPNGDTVSAQFDAADELTATQAASTASTSTPLASLTYTRDSAGQVTRETASAALTGTNTYGYTAKLELANANGSAYTYDLSGNPTKLGTAVTQTFDSSNQLTATTSATTTTHYAYDANGNRTSAAPDAGTAYTYSYDQANRLTTVTSSTVTAPPVLIAITPQSGPTTGGTTVTLTGTGFRGATAVSFGQTAVAFSVASDTTITAVSPSGTGTVDVTVTTPVGSTALTPADRFTYTTSPGAKPTVTLVVPNRGRTTGGDLVAIAGTHLDHATAVHFGPTAARFFQSPWLPNLILAASPPGHGTVDITVTTAAGTSPKTSRDRFTYLSYRSNLPLSDQWKVPANYRTTATPLPKPATAPRVATAPSATVATYTYNGDGLRSTKQTGPTSQTFVWDPAGQQPQLLLDGSTAFIYGPDGHVIEQIDSTGAASYYFHDQLGSTRALLGSDGKISATFAYDAFGRTTSQMGTNQTPLQFAGGYRDGETGFIYLINRYYDPATGQFLTVDPALDVSLSAYDYTEDNPVNETDPTGLFLHIALGAAVGAFAGTIVGAGGYLVDVGFGGESFSWRGLGGATAGGFVGGAAAGSCEAASLGTATPLCLAISGAGGELVNQTITGRFDPWGLATATVFSSLVPNPFKLIGRRPTSLTNIWKTGVNTWRMFGNDFFDSIGDSVTQRLLRRGSTC